MTINCGNLKVDLRTKFNWTKIVTFACASNNPDINYLKKLVMLLSWHIQLKIQDVSKLLCSNYQRILRLQQTKKESLYKRRLGNAS